MKLVVSKLELMKLLGKIQNVVPVKATMPILSNFLLTAKNGEVTLTATDLTVGIKACASAKVLEEGATTLPARRFIQLVRELTAVNVEIQTDPRDITEIKAGSSHFKLNGMRSSEFPNLPDFAEASHCQFKAPDLKDVLSRTAFAVSKEDTRYALTGVLMKLEERMGTFVGTDGKKLAKTKISLAAEIDNEVSGNYIIPLKAVEEITKLLPDEGIATLFLVDDKIAVQVDDFTLITKLLAGDYPDFERVIPQDSSVAVPLHREELMTLLRQVVLFTTDLSDSVRFTLEQGELKLSANSSDIGEGRVSMIANYEGPKLEIAFNPTYFLDILKHCKQENITVSMTDSFNPGIITDSEGGKSALDESALFVLMPMRLSEE